MRLSDGRSLGSLKVTELREELERRGASKSGTKNVLIERLDALLVEEAKQAPVEPPAAAPPVADDVVSKYLSESSKELDAIQRLAEKVRGATPPVQSPPVVETRTEVQEQKMSVNGAVHAPEPAVHEPEPAVHEPEPVVQEIQQPPVQVQLANDASDNERQASEEPGGGTVTDDGYVTVEQRSDSLKPSEDGDRGRSMSKTPPKCLRSHSPNEKCRHDEEDSEGEKETEISLDVGVELSQPKVEPAPVEETIELGSAGVVDLQTPLDDDMDALPKRKRKWQAGKKRAAVSAVSTDSLNDLVGGISQEELSSVASQPVAEEEMEVAEVDVDVAAPEEKGELSPPPPKRIVVADNEQDEAGGAGETAEDGTLSSTSPTRRQRRPASPAHNAPSNFLMITGLSRPYTRNQLIELLLETSGGQLVKDEKGSNNSDLWLNNLRSTCYAHFETEEQATKVREILHGDRWPQGNTKRLTIEYTTEKDMYYATGVLVREEVDHIKDVARGTGEEVDLTRGESAAKLPSKDKLEELTISIHQKRRHSDQRGDPDKPLAQTKKEEPPTRERRKESPPRRRRSPSPRVERPLRERKERSPDRKPREPPAEKQPRMLDELFKRTTTLPAIYWMPLSEDDIERRNRAREREERHRRERERMGVDRPRSRSPRERMPLVDRPDRGAMGRYRDDRTDHYIRPRY